MPGRLMMNTAGAEGAGSGGHVQSSSAENAPGAKNTKPSVNGNPVMAQTDGPSDTRNGALVNGVQSPKSLLDMPPELRHVTEGLFSFRKLLANAARSCWEDLQDTLKEMAQMPDGSQGSGMSNGIHGHMANGSNNPTIIPAAKNKKIKMMEFAERQRTRFVKLLVISQWTVYNDDLRKIIDIWNYVIEQQGHFTEAAWWVGQQRWTSDRWKEPNPDIRTALEVLSTGKAPWMPDFGYIPQKPLSAKETLKLLRNMNTLLSIRINLHEELPRHLRQYDVKNGRATFTVPGEFELDVSIPDDNPESSFYFIDLRFTFTPQIELPDGRFLAGLEPELNLVLATSGLSGCYDYLHNFCLTLKIQTLRRQATRMILSNWANALRIELVRRVLIVQYWTDMPGGKNWIEIGVSSGHKRPGRSAWRGPEPPYLSMKWIRNGKEVEAPEVDWSSLSLEEMLLQVISQHTRHIFESIHRKLQTMVQIDSTLTTKLSLDDVDPSNSRLEITMAKPTNRVEIAIDPITGKFAICPCSLESSRTENEMNNQLNPSEDAARIIIRLLSANLRQHIEKQADQYGWERPSYARLNLKVEDVRSAFQQDVLQSGLFRGQGWGSTWLIAVIINLTGETWFLIELEETPTGSKIVNKRQISTQRFGVKMEPVTQDFLRRLEFQAVADLGTFACARALKRREVPHQWAIEEKKQRLDREGSGTTDILCVKMDALLQKASKVPVQVPPLILRLSHVGFAMRDGKVEHIIQGEVKHKDTVNLGQMKAARDDRIRFHADGGFTTWIFTPFGESCISPLVDRLRNIYFLRSFVDALRKQGIAKPSLISLSSIIFTYSNTSQLTATIKLPDDKTPQTRITFSPTNPQTRIRALLQNELNSKAISTIQALPAFTQHLLATLPLMRAFATIETIPSKPPFNVCPPPSILPRGTTWFRIVYASPNPTCSFDILLRLRGDSTVWHIEDNLSKSSIERSAPEKDITIPPTPSTPANTKPETIPFRRDENLGVALKSLWGERGTNWSGINTGIVAEIHGVEAAILRLDEVVRSCRREEDIKKVTAMRTNIKTEDSGPSSTAKPAPQLQPPPAQKQRPNMHLNLNPGPNQTQIQAQNQNQAQAARKQTAAMNLNMNRAQQNKQHPMHGRSLSQNQNQVQNQNQNQAQMQQRQNLMMQQQQQGRAPQAQMQAPKPGQKAQPEVITLD